VVIVGKIEARIGNISPGKGSEVRDSLLYSYTIGSSSMGGDTKSSGVI